MGARISFVGSWKMSLGPDQLCGELENEPGTRSALWRAGEQARDEAGAALGSSRPRSLSSPGRGKGPAMPKPCTGQDPSGAVAGAFPALGRSRCS